MTHAPAPHCRFCHKPLVHTFVDLGLSPLANRNLGPDELMSERKYPLIARVCENCLLVQVDDSVPPEEIFADYDYFSSFSDSWVAHAKRYCDAMCARFALSSKSFVAEVASNDGYLLQHFVARGIRVLGIEPAANVAKAALERNVPTEVTFFGAAAARRIAAVHGHADLVAANNVLAHVPDTQDFVGGFAELLGSDGVATFEFPHLLNLINQVQFDTIYHEHFFYLSLLVVEKMMAQAGLRVFDVEELPTHGGSLRVFACRQGARHVPTDRVEAIRFREQEAGLDRLQGYEGYADRVARVRTGFRKFVEDAHRAGKTIAAYGAAAKGNTFLNYCGIRYPDILAIYDRNPAKQGKLSPGAHIPILDPAEMASLKPDYVVILPWNIADEVRHSISGISKWGGRFVIAIPETRVL